MSVGRVTPLENQISHLTTIALPLAFSRDEHAPAHRRRFAKTVSSVSRFVDKK